LEKVQTFLQKHPENGIKISKLGKIVVHALQQPERRVTLTAILLADPRFKVGTRVYVYFFGIIVNRLIDELALKIRTPHIYTEISRETGRT